MSRYYRLTEWALVKRWLLIGLVGLVTLFLLWLIINLQFQYCPGKIDCKTAPKHSLSNLL